MFCSQCGKEIEEGAGFCKYCGAKFVKKEEPTEKTDGKKIFGWAIVSLICGILGICLAMVPESETELWVMVFPLTFGIVAIVLGGIGISVISRSENLRGKGVALAGLILGIVGVIVFFIICVVVATQESAQSPYPYLW